VFKLPRKAYIWLAGFAAVLAMLAALDRHDHAAAGRVPSLLKYSDAKASCSDDHNHTLSSCLQRIHGSGIVVLSDEFVTPEFVKRYRDAIIASVAK